MITEQKQAVARPSDERRFLEASVEELWRRLEKRNEVAAPGAVPIRRGDLERWARQFEPPDAAEMALFDGIE